MSKKNMDLFYNPIILTPSQQELMNNSMVCECPKCNSRNLRLQLRKKDDDYYIISTCVNCHFTMDEKYNSYGERIDTITPYSKFGLQLFSPYTIQLRDNVLLCTLIFYYYLDDIFIANCYGNFFDQITLIARSKNDYSQKYSFNLICVQPCEEMIKNLVKSVSDNNLDIDYDQDGTPYRGKNHNRYNYLIANFICEIPNSVDLSECNFNIASYTISK